MRGRDGGDGVDRRLLDSALRDPRSAWLRGGGGERPRRQARPGPQDGCQATPLGCSACTNTGCCGPGFLAGRARSRPCGATCASASGCSRGGRPHPAHAESADRDEPAAPSRRRGRDGRDGPAHPPGSGGRRARSGHPGGLQRPACCRAPAETLRAALVGNYREEHVFALAQALETGPISITAKVAACDQRIEAVLERLEGCHTRLRRRRCRRPAPGGGRPMSRVLPVAQALHAILGADPTQIDGIGPSLALTLVGECGTNLLGWPSAEHFTSWLSLAPHNKISGGKVLSARTRRSGSRAAALLRLAAVAVGRTATAWGLLPPSGGAGGQGQGSHRDGAQDRRSLLQHAPPRHGLRRSGRFRLRGTLPAAGPEQSPTP